MTCTSLPLGSSNLTCVQLQEIRPLRRQSAFVLVSVLTGLVCSVITVALLLLFSYLIRCRCLRRGFRLMRWPPALLRVKVNLPNIAVTKLEIHVEHLLEVLRVSHDGDLVLGLLAQPLLEVVDPIQELLEVHRRPFLRRLLRQQVHLDDALDLSGHGIRCHGPQHPQARLPRPQQRRVCHQRDARGLQKVHLLELVAHLLDLFGADVGDVGIHLRLHVEQFRRRLDVGGGWQRAATQRLEALAQRRHASVLL
mmetsp:Transcript_21350/g.59359  ORF Transcript_21350/g.59359 Transcript_21350/m.59359 type:complete len:252 (+) Transcript_21350:1092-1847(+)